MTAPHFVFSGRSPAPMRALLLMVVMALAGCGEAVLSIDYPGGPSTSLPDIGTPSTPDVDVDDAPPEADPSLPDPGEDPGFGSTEDEPDDPDEPNLPDTPIDAGQPDATEPPVPLCSDECGFVGEQRCVGDGLATCAMDTAKGCLVLGAPQACGNAKICDSAKQACVEACGDNCETFSVMLLPDTQYYTQETSNDSNNYNKQLQWIVNNKTKENIRFTIHLGDITNNNTIEQWEVANKAHKLLDNANVPYSMVTGNHDYIGTTPSRSNTHFGTYFGKERFAGKSWYGGSNSTVNNYTFFEVGHMKFMVLSLEYAPRKESVCWADELIRKHPDRHVIIATHCYLTHDAKYGGSCPSLPYATNGSRGTDLWNELVARHSNVFMVVCGHVGDSEYRKRTGNLGNSVHEMLVDYQFEKRCAASSASACKQYCRGNPGSGNGWMRQLIFNPRTNTVTAKTFTVQDGNTSVFPGGKPAFYCSEQNTEDRNWYPSDPSNAAHQYSFTFDMNSKPTYKYDSKGHLGFNARGINATGSGQQYGPAVAVAPDGHFIAVWEDDSSSADGAGKYDIFARGFHAGGCASGIKEFTVNVETAGDQRHPDIAMDAAGNFVVVWEDDKDGNGIYEIYMRGFHADGSQRFGRKRVNSVSSGQQYNPKIAMAPDGRFSVAWEDYSNDSTMPQIFVRGFHSDGSQRFADRNVMDTAEGSRRKPDIFLDDNANIVVTWEDDTDANGSYQIHAKGLTTNGSDRFTRKTVNSVADGQQFHPVIQGALNGDFVILWEDDKDKDGKYSIRGRAFSANGASRGADFAVSSTSGNHTQPAICVNGDGSWTATWTNDAAATGEATDVYYRYYNANGTPSDATRANYIEGGLQSRSAIGCTSSGERVILWQDDMDGNGYYEIFGRGFVKQ